MLHWFFFLLNKKYSVYDGFYVDFVVVYEAVTIAAKCMEARFAENLFMSPCGLISFNSFHCPLVVSKLLTTAYEAHLF